MAYLKLTGGISDLVSSPDAAVLRVTGDIDLRARFSRPDWFSSAEFYPVARWHASLNRRSYALAVASNLIRLYWSTDGTSGTQVSASSTATFAFVNEVATWVRATLDVNNEAGGYDVNFYTGGTGGTPSWTQLGLTITGGATTSIFAGTQQLEIGSVNSGDAAFPAKVYRAQIYDGIDGTLVFDADPSDPNTWAPDRRSFTEKANGATVTLQGGGAELVGGGFPLLLLGVG